MPFWFLLNSASRSDDPVYEHFAFNDCVANISAVIWYTEYLFSAPRNRHTQIDAFANSEKTRYRQSDGLPGLSKLYLSVRKSNFL